VPTILQMIVSSPIAKQLDLSAWKVVIGGARLAKNKGMIDKRTPIKQAVEKYVKDGMNIGIGGFVNTRVPTALIWNVVKRAPETSHFPFNPTPFAVSGLQAP